MAETASTMKFASKILVTETEANILDVDGLRRVLQEISYPVPENAERVPWLERLDYVVQDTIPDEIDSTADVARENALHDLTLKGAQQALMKLKYLGVPFTRPNDFYAEMIKSDEHMRRVQERLDSQEHRIQAVEERKRRQAQRKFGKKAKAEAARQKAAEKRQMLRNIEEWKKERKAIKGNETLHTKRSGTTTSSSGKRGVKGKPSQREGGPSLTRGGRQHRKQAQDAHSLSVRRLDRILQ